LQPIRETVPACRRYAAGLAVKVGRQLPLERPAGADLGGSSDDSHDLVSDGTPKWRRFPCAKPICHGNSRWLSAEAMNLFGKSRLDNGQARRGTSPRVLSEISEHVLQPRGSSNPRYSPVGRKGRRIHGMVRAVTDLLDLDPKRRSAHRLSDGGALISVCGCVQNLGAPACHVCFSSSQLR